MLDNVRLYKNTGLTPSSCLDSSSRLDSLAFDHYDVEAIATKQDRQLREIRVNITNNKVKQCDYCRIGNECYWITGVHQVNDNVAILVLVQDYLTTIGINNISVVSGWCTRRHVTDDKLYSNTIAEPFVPTSKLEIDFGKVIQGGSSDGLVSIVVSSVDLTAVTDKATAYFDEDRDKVLVPDIPNSVNGLTKYNSHVVEPVKQTYIPMTNAYNLADASVQNGIKSVRQLGIESCIGAAYSIPGEWVSTSTDEGGVFTLISDNHQEVVSEFGWQWGEYKNNKVYSGQFQKIIVFSMASGEKNEFRVEDIVMPNSGIIHWMTFADCRYNGKPGCKPKYFHNVLNTTTLQSISGAQWQQTPLLYNISSGWGFTAQQGVMDSLNNTRGLINNEAGAILNGLNSGLFGAAFSGDDKNPYPNTANTVSGISNAAFRASTSIGDYLVNRQSIFANTNKALVDVDMEYPIVPQLADYIGNSFYEMRYRLSDNDMKRFDDYLSAYGYAVDEKLTMSCFKGRTNHNYVKGYGVLLKADNIPQYLLDGAANQICTGVDIWHTKPSSSKLYDNPIAS